MAGNQENSGSGSNPGSKLESDRFPQRFIVSSRRSSKAVENVISFEEILEELGCFGPYQVMILFLYSFMEIAAAFVVFIPIAVGRSSTLFTNCTGDDLSNSTEDSTSNTTTPVTGNTSVAMDNHTTSFTTQADVITRSIFHAFETVWKDPFKYESLVDEWNLKCDRAWIPDVFTSGLMAGMFAGSLIWCQLADWYGRRPAYLMILFTMFLGTAMSGSSPNIYFYAVSRFMCGCGYAGFIGISCMTGIEFMTPKWRSFANVVGPIGEGIIILSVLGYFIRPWRQLYLVTLTPYILIIPIYYLLPESPRWLLRNKKVAEAHAVLNRMAKLNGCPPVTRETLEAFRKQEELANMSQNQKRLSYWTFLKNKKLRTKAIYLFGIFFSWNVGYYGVSYNIRNVPGNTYHNMALIGLANAIGQRASWPACEWFGRRRAVLYEMTLAAVFFVLLAICFLTVAEVNSVMILVACFVALFGLAGARASMRLLAGETFPTAVRNMGLAMGGVGGCLAGLLTPQTAYLGSRWPSLPFFIFAVISVLGAMIVFMMKETSGNPLSDEVQISKKQNSGNT